MMKRNEIIDELVPDCPIRNILARISDKWSLLVLYTLNQEPTMRFNALQKSLTVTLKTLEEDGFVSRKIYAEVPPKVEYSLTDRALSLLPCINTLIAWAKENMKDIIQDRKKSKKIKEGK